MLLLTGSALKSKPFSPGIWRLAGLSRPFISKAIFLTRERQTPFYRWPSLGGHNSYRGAGDGRWVDRNLLALTLEQRIEMFRLHHFGVVSHWEVAPFLDVGKVFPTIGKFNFKDFHPAGGVAFRALVRPQVVGHVEVGFGSGGNNAVFMGLDYPF